MADVDPQNNNSTLLFVFALVLAVPAWALVGVFSFVLDSSLVLGVRLLLGFGVCALGWEAISTTKAQPPLNQTQEYPSLPPPPLNVPGLSSPPQSAEHTTITAAPAAEAPQPSAPTAIRIAGLTALGIGLVAAIVAIVIGLAISALLAYLFWAYLTQ